MATNKTVEVDFEGGDKLDKYLHKLALRLGQGGEAKIGFIDGATYPADDGGESVAQVAFWNEFGTSKAPPRPFFRNMIEDQAATWSHKLGVAVRYANYRARPALEILAADIKGHLVESINMLQDPPLSAYTIEKKGFAKPLIDKGVMVRHVSWDVTTDEPKKENT